MAIKYLTDLDIIGKIDLTGNVTGNSFQGDWLTYDNANASNWQEAFSWGDHSLAGYELALNKNNANGYAGLDSNTKIPISLLPDLAISSTSVVSSEANMLALLVQKGDVAVRTDVNETYILAGDDPAVLADWQKMLTPTDSVNTVNGLAGNVQLDLTFSSGDLSITGGNTVDLDSRYPLLDHTHTVANITNLQASLDSKLNLSGGTLTGQLTVNSIVQTDEIRNRTGQQLVLNVGESHAYTPNQVAEYLYINSENGIEINTSPDNWTSGWAGRVTSTITNTGITWDGNTVYHQANLKTGLDANSVAYTNVDNNFSVTQTIINSYPRLNLYSTDVGEDDWSVINNNGSFGIYNATDTGYALSINGLDSTFGGNINVYKETGDSKISLSRVGVASLKLELDYSGSTASIKTTGSDPLALGANGQTQLTFSESSLTSNFSGDVVMGTPTYFKVDATSNGGYEISRSGFDTWQLRHLDGGLTFYNETDNVKLVQLIDSTVNVTGNLDVTNTGTFGGSVTINSASSGVLQINNSSNSVAQLSSTNSYLAITSAAYIQLQRTTLFYGGLWYQGDGQNLIRSTENDASWVDILNIDRTTNTLKFGTVQAVSTGGDTAFYHSGVEKARLTDVGLGIGTLTPEAPIHTQGVVDGTYTAAIFANAKTYGVGTGINETVKIALSLKENGTSALGRIMSSFVSGAITETSSAYGFLDTYVRYNSVEQLRFKIDSANNTLYSSTANTSSNILVLRDALGTSKFSVRADGRLDIFGTTNITGTLDVTSKGTFSGNIDVLGDIVAKANIDAQGAIYHRGNIGVLNKTASSWLNWAVRDVSGAEAVIDLSNIGSINSSNQFILNSNVNTSTLMQLNAADGNDGFIHVSGGLSTDDSGIRFQSAQVSQWGILTNITSGKLRFYDYVNGKDFVEFFPNDKVLIKENLEVTDNLKLTSTSLLYFGAQNFREVSVNNAVRASGGFETIGLLRSYANLAVTGWGSFTGRVSGADAVSNNEFVTLQQLNTQVATVDTLQEVTTNGNTITNNIIINNNNAGTSVPTNNHITAELRLKNLDSTNNNFSAISNYSSTNLVNARIGFRNVNHTDRSGQIEFLTHSGNGFGTRYVIDKDGYNTWSNGGAFGGKVDITSTGFQQLDIRNNNTNQATGLALYNDVDDFFKLENVSSDYATNDSTRRIKMYTSSTTKSIDIGGTSRDNYAIRIPTTGDITLGRNVNASANLNATGNATANSFRTTTTTDDYSFIYRDGTPNATQYSLYVQNSNESVAKFISGSNVVASGGTTLLDITLNKVSVGTDLDVSGTVTGQVFKTGNFLVGQLGLQIESGNSVNTTLRFESDNFRFYSGSTARVPLTMNQDGSVNFYSTGTFGDNIHIDKVYGRLKVGRQGSDGDVHFGSSGIGGPTNGTQEYGFYTAYNAYRDTDGFWKHSRTDLTAYKFSGGLHEAGFSWNRSPGAGTGNIAWTELMKLDNGGNLNVTGKIKSDTSLQVANDTDTASVTNVGSLRYRTSGNNSYVDMCMQTGASTYEWINIVQNNW